MIHMAQCLCGPARHAIYAIQYKDSDMTPEEARIALEAMIEVAIQGRVLRRRCEICDKDVAEFWYEDAITREQDWGKALEVNERLELEQVLTQVTVKALRKAEKN